MPYAIKSKEVISYWEELKKLIARENIWADPQIQKIDEYFDQQLKSEL